MNDETEPLAYLNGEYPPFPACRLHVADLGIVQGATVTEMIRTFAGNPFRPAEHLERFRASLSALGLEPAESLDDIHRIAARLIAHNAPLIPGGQDLGIVIFATAGEHRMYLSPIADTTPRPSLCVHTVPLPFERWSEKYERGARLAIPPVRQMPPDVIDPRIKHRSRLHWFLAEREARRIDPAATALLLDARGHVTETYAANLLVVRDDELLLPGERTTLSGVSRRFVCGLAREMGVPGRFAELTPADVLAAEEVLLTSTSFCLLPVVALDGEAVGGGRPGPLFQRLIAEWSRRVGVDIIAQARSAARDRIA